MTGTSKASLAQLPVTLGDIEAAAGVLDGFVKRTGFDRSRTLSDITGASLWLKFENLQFTATFKERGALNRLSALSADERARGVIAASAGNHALGVAYHAARLAIPATIFVPVGTPTVKIENTRRHGATVIEAGATLEEAAALAVAHGRAQRLTFEAGLKAGPDPWAAVDEPALGAFAQRGAGDVAAFLSNTPEAIAAAEKDSGTSVVAGQHPRDESPRSNGVAQLR